MEDQPAGKGETSFVALRAEAWADRRRVRASVQADYGSPIPPYLHLSILDPEDREVSEMLVMGLEDSSVEVTLHLRPPAPHDEVRPYRLLGRLFYGEEGQAEITCSQAEVAFSFPEE